MKSKQKKAIEELKARQEQRKLMLDSIKEEAEDKEADVENVPVPVAKEEEKGVELRAFTLG